MQHRRHALFAAIATALCYLPPALAADSEIDVLKQRINSLEQRLEATANAVDSKSAASASSATHIGGYGEVHFTTNDMDRGAGDPKKVMDVRRFVLYFGHEFSDKLRFHSELELEHALVAGNEDKGEVELEQAFIDLKLRPEDTLRTGLFLIPVGIINETHEPPTFYGVARNPVETWIIPTTWRETGASLYGKLAPGISYDVALTTGFKADPLDFNIRESHQEGSKATANSPAYTLRLKWTGLPGVELAGTMHHQADLTQRSPGTAGETVPATLSEMHAAVHQGQFGLRALYAHWHLGGDGPKALGRERQYGWYVEPSYRLAEKLGVFARYNSWDTQAGDAINSHYKQSNVGISYWPRPQVVFKADLQRRNDNQQGFNLGVGYQF